MKRMMLMTLEELLQANNEMMDNPLEKGLEWCKNKRERTLKKIEDAKLNIEKTKVDGFSIGSNLYKEEMVWLRYEISKLWELEIQIAILEKLQKGDK